MKNLFLLILILSVFQNSNAQKFKLKIGDKAPVVNIEHYLQNKPQNTDLKNKYILLEFWATWCKPCIQEVPKINSLAEKYSNRKDVVFISITDESPEIIKKSLNKIVFKSSVASDQSLTTHKNFITYPDGSYSIPKTILIGPDGIIRWIGVTMNLNAELFDKFIAGQEILKSDETPFDIPEPTFLPKKN